MCSLTPMRKPGNKGLDSQEEARLCVPEENCGRLEAGGRSRLALLQVISNTHGKHACNQQNFITHIICSHIIMCIAGCYGLLHMLSPLNQNVVSQAWERTERQEHAQMCAVVAHCIADWQSSVALQSALVFAQQPWLPNALNTSPSVSVYYDNVVWAVMYDVASWSISHYLPWSSSCLQGSPWWGWCDREPFWGYQSWGGRRAQRTNSDGSTEPREERTKWCNYKFWIDV